MIRRTEFLTRVVKVTKKHIHETLHENLRGTDLLEILHMGGMIILKWIWNSI